MMALGDGGTGNAGSGGAGGTGASGDAGSGGSSGGAGNAAGGAAGSGGSPSGTTGSGVDSSGGGAPDPKLGSGGQAQASWRDSLPDDLKADPTLSKYSDVTNLSKAHIELQKKFGQKGVFKPGKDASPEEIKSFREAMGIPTDPTKYDMGKFEGMEVPAATLTWAQKMGAEHGIEPSALKAVISDYMKLEGTLATANATKTKEQVAAGLASLKTEWGDGYDRNIARANFAAEKMGGAALIDRLVKLGVQNDPVLLKALSAVAPLYGEDKLREAGAGDGQSTPQELDAEIASVQGRLLSMKPTDGAYASVKLKFESLWKQKTRGK